MSTPTLLTPDELRLALSVRDLTDPGQGPHAIQLVARQIVQAQAAAGPAVDVRTGGPVVPLADNYDNLGYEPDAVTRDARYTRYVDRDHVLRSHTSARVPPALRDLARHPGLEDLLIVSAGMCYRRDSIDWQHTGTPHQLDLWRITRDSRSADDRALTAMIGAVVEAVLPSAAWRTVPSPHPYTTLGREIQAEWHGEWVEIGECGLAAGHVLHRAGLDRDHAGLAMGLGLDRLLMLRKGIPDIRLLRSSDPRVASQMLDLTPYRSVSQQPPVRRDLSVVLGAHAEANDEILGDRVRIALGNDAEVVETVEVVSEMSYDELPALARHRLGIVLGQRNVLVRLVLRPLDRTLTDHEANLVRDRVYAELHEGSTAHWATR